MASNHLTKTGALLDGDFREAREIENHYQQIVIAENTQQLVQLQARSLEVQKHAAIAQLHAEAAAAYQRQEGNQFLSSIDEGIHRLGIDIRQVRIGIGHLNSTAVATYRAIEEQTGVLVRGFQHIAEQMMAQKQKLDEISDFLRQPHKTEIQELLRDADRILKRGANSTGRDQNEDFSHSISLLDLVLSDPIGMSNYIAWFQTGWLRWKFESDKEKAEEAFYQASRNSKDNPLFRAYALRHCACLQYEQEKWEEAYATIASARESWKSASSSTWSNASSTVTAGLTPGSDRAGILYDSARYAAKTGRIEEAAKHLDASIEARPIFSISMLSESDFMV